MVPGHTAGGVELSPLILTSSCLLSKPLLCPVPGARTTKGSKDMIFALLELAIWQERLTSKSHSKFKARYRREVSAGCWGSVRKGFPEDVTFGLKQGTDI